MRSDQVEMEAFAALFLTHPQSHPLSDRHTHRFALLFEEAGTHAVTPVGSCTLHWSPDEVHPQVGGPRTDETRIGASIDEDGRGAITISSTGIASRDRRRPTLCRGGFTVRSFDLLHASGGGVGGPETTLPTLSCGSSCEGHPFPFRFVPGSSSTRKASLKGKAPEEKGTNPRYEGSWFWRVFHARLRRPSRRRRRLRSVPAFVRRGCAPWKEATVPPKPSCCRLRACRGACETPSSGVRRMPPPETAERKGSCSSPLGASRASAFVSNERSTECIRTCVRERQRRAKVDPQGPDKGGGCDQRNGRGSNQARPINDAIEAS